MNLEEIRALRRALHSCPEQSGREKRTRAMLMDFLRGRTELELHPCGEGFYAARREPEGTKPPIALRADYDALALPGGGAAHLCGHDGHAAALCGTILSLKDAANISRSFGKVTMKQMLVLGTYCLASHSSISRSRSVSHIL